MVFLELVVVLVGARPQLDLLDPGALLVPALLVHLLVEVVQVLAIVHDLANGRLGGGGDFDQVESLFPGPFQGFLGRHEAHLLAGVVNQADFPDPNPFVHP